MFASQKTRILYVFSLCFLCVHIVKTMIQSRQFGSRKVRAAPVCDKREQAT